MEAQEAKAKMLYAAGKAEQVTLLEALQAARAFVDANSEPWYYSGQQLLGKIDGAIEAAARGAWTDVPVNIEHAKTMAAVAAMYLAEHSVPKEK